MLPTKRWAPIEQRPPSAAPRTRPSSGSWQAAGRAEALGRGGEVAVAHNYDAVGAIVAERVARTDGRITAKRLLPVAGRPATAARPATSAGRWPRPRPSGA